MQSAATAGILRQPLVAASLGRNKALKSGFTVPIVSRYAELVSPNALETAARLGAAGGGYEVVHESPGLELGVYVLIHPQPDTQAPHRYDEVYVVLEGRGEIEIEGEQKAVGPGDQVFVRAEAEHRFCNYERLVLYVIFNGPHTRSKHA